MFWLTLAVSSADASPPSLCDVLLDGPTPETVQAALDRGGDPNEICRWTKQVPMANTLGGVLTAVLLPVVSWPIVFTEEVTQKKSALPLVLAVGRRSEPLVTALLGAGARPYSGAVDEAVAFGGWEIARQLIDVGAAPTVTKLGGGDLQWLERVRSLGITLSSVDTIGSGAVLTDAAVAASFLDEGLRIGLLLEASVARGTVDVVRVCAERLPPSEPAMYIALREAAVAGKWDIVEILRGRGVSWEMSGQEPVLVAVVASGSAAGVDRLLASGADVDKVSKADGSALHAAVGINRRDLVQKLLDAGATVDITDIWGKTPLHEAAKAGSLPLVELLLARGASLQVGAPLAGALESGQLPIAARLIRAGALVDDAALSTIARSHRPDALRLLVANGLDPAARLASGETLPVLAIEANNPAMFAALAKVGAPLDGTTADDSALIAAALAYEPAWINRVLAAGADPATLPRESAVWEDVDEERWHAVIERLGVPAQGAWLMDAADDNDLEQVRYLLAHGAEPNVTDTFGRAPIDRTRDPQIELLLLAAGARPTAELIERLVDEGAWEHLSRLTISARQLDPYVCDRASAGDEVGVRWLLAHGADPNRAGSFGDTPLGVASKDNAVDIVEALIAAGASLDRLDTFGRTPLHLAADSYAVDVVPVLIRAGAPLDAEDPFGRTAIELGLRHSSAIVDVFLEAGHPYTAAIIQKDARWCRMERLSRYTWAEVPARSTLRKAARQGDCVREIREMVRARSQ